MENLLVSDIAKILEEKNFNIAAEELEKVTNLDCFGTENFLHVLIGLVIIFKSQLTSLVETIFQKITSESAGI